jgi:hypothetical protein
MWLAWITDNASARSLLIKGAVAVVFEPELFALAERSGLLPEVRRAERVCCEKMIAGSARAIIRNKTPAIKDLFLKPPS